MGLSTMIFYIHFWMLIKQLQECSDSGRRTSVGNVLRGNFFLFKYGFRFLDTFFGLNLDGICKVEGKFGRGGVRCAVYLLKEDSSELLRRIGIICLEDGLLHPALPLIVWLTAAEVSRKWERCWRTCLACPSARMFYS